MKPHEIKICLGALAAGVVLLTSLWGFLLSTSLYHKAGIGKGPYNPYTTAPDRPVQR